MRVLLIEDDPMIGAAILEGLKDANYAADWVRDGQVALTTFGCQQYDMALLDLGLPGKDGFQVLAHLRNSENPLPVMIVTARDAVQDRVRGLDSGADDYIVKPFEISELLARMRAVLRRHSGATRPILSNGTVSLDPVTKEASVDGAAIRLSGKEFALLQALMLRPGAIYSRAELEEKIYGWGQEVESNAVDFLIHALRKKLGSQVIKNIRGMGWMVSKEA